MATQGCKWSGIGGAPEVVEVLEIDSATFAANDIVTLSGGSVSYTHLTLPTTPYV